MIAEARSLEEELEDVMDAAAEDAENSDAGDEWGFRDDEEEAGDDAGKSDSDQEETDTEGMPAIFEPAAVTRTNATVEPASTKKKKSFVCKVVHQCKLCGATSDKAQQHYNYLYVI